MSPKSKSKTSGMQSTIRGRNSSYSHKKSHKSQRRYKKTPVVDQTPLGVETSFSNTLTPESGLISPNGRSILGPTYKLTTLLNSQIVINEEDAAFNRSITEETEAPISTPKTHQDKRNQTGSQKIEIWNQTKDEHMKIVVNKLPSTSLIKHEPEKAVRADHFVGTRSGSADLTNSEQVPAIETPHMDTFTKKRGTTSVLNSNNNFKLQPHSTRNSVHTTK